MNQACSPLQAQEKTALCCVKCGEFLRLLEVPTISPEWQKSEEKYFICPHDGDSIFLRIWVRVHNTTHRNPEYSKFKI